MSGFKVRPAYDVPPEHFPDAQRCGVDPLGCLVLTVGQGEQERPVAVFAPGHWDSFWPADPPLAGGAS